MTQQSPTYESGRLTREDLCVGGARPRHEKSGAQQYHTPLTQRVLDGRISKSSPLAKRPRRASSQSSDERGSNSQTADSRTKVHSEERSLGGEQHDSPEQMREAALDLLKTSEDEEDESYDGGSDSDWDEYPRVRRRMAKYLIEKYSIDGCLRWTPFQAKLHKLLSMIEGYPVMENDWKFPYFGEWVIPLGDQPNSPLAPAGLQKRVALKAYGDQFRALKAMKRLFNLSSQLAGYRQMEDMEDHIAPALAKELELYWQWAMEDAGLDKKDCFKNVMVVPLVMDREHSPDLCAAEGLQAAHGDPDTETNAEVQAASKSDNDGGNDAASVAPPRELNTDAVDQPEASKTGDGLDTEAAHVANASEPKTKAPGIASGTPSPGDQLQEEEALKLRPADPSTKTFEEQPKENVSSTKNAVESAENEEDEGAKEGEQGARQLEQAIHDLGVREYGSRCRQHVEARSGEYLASLDFVLFVIVQHRIMVCGLDVSKPDSDLVVMTTFNMADTRQWLWNTLKLAIPIHMARDELLRVAHLFDDLAPTIRAEQDPDL